MKEALIILSGGQDSTTCLFWAKKKFDTIHALTIDYGQRHKVEVESAIKIAQLAGVKTHEIVDVGNILKGSSPLINDTEVGQYPSIDELPQGMEPTFIPARNPLFWVIAANRAVGLNISDIISGVCEADFAGYHDCREYSVIKMQEALGINIFNDVFHFTFHAPLMYLTKRQTVLVAKSLGDKCWEALAHSHTCYNGIFPPCKKCHACLLRQRGFDEANEIDPLLQRQESQLSFSY